MAYSHCEDYLILIFTSWTWWGVSSTLFHNYTYYWYHTRGVSNPFIQGQYINMWLLWVNFLFPDESKNLWEMRQNLLESWQRITSVHVMWFHMAIYQRHCFLPFVEITVYHSFRWHLCDIFGISINCHYGYVWPIISVWYLWNIYLSGISGYILLIKCCRFILLLFCFQTI